jgi:hypothetical protein
MLHYFSVTFKTAETTCDLIHAKRDGNHTLLGLKSGLHGIESYTGSTMQLHFWKNIPNGSTVVKSMYC